MDNQTQTDEFMSIFVQNPHFVAIDRQYQLCRGSVRGDSLPTMSGYFESNLPVEMKTGRRQEYSLEEIWYHGTLLYIAFYAVFTTGNKNVEQFRFVWQRATIMQ